MTTETTTRPTVRLIHGDCLEVLKTLDAGSVDAVVTDPPWGIDADTDYTRFVNGKTRHIDHGGCIKGDTSAFDPRRWLPFPRVALWGANCFSELLPMGRWLVWTKKRDSQLGTFMSDAELCWVNKKKTPRRAPGVYCFRHVWHGFDRESERGVVLHPTQKPIEVMRWTLEMTGVQPGMTVLDPYMGSGTTGVACVKAGVNFIGCEIDPTYFATAERRIAEANDTLF
jgi:DNA modification methylase